MGEPCTTKCCFFYGRAAIVAVQAAGQDEGHHTQGGQGRGDHSGGMEDDYAEDQADEGCGDEDDEVDDEPDQDEDEDDDDDGGDGGGGGRALHTSQVLDFGGDNDDYEDCGDNAQMSPQGCHGSAAAYSQVCSPL